MANVNDSTAIQNAIDVVELEGKTVLLLPKTYLINTTLSIPSKVSLIGFGSKTCLDYQQ